MTWLDSLEIPIEDALARFPEQVNVASITDEGQTYLVALSSLQNMHRMQLSHLPVSSVALPYQLSELLTRPHEENLVRDVSHHLSDFFPNFFVAAIYEMQSFFTTHGFNAYIVGGITRDMLISAERRYDIQDVDITIEGKALDAGHIIDADSRNFDLEQAFEPFGTAKLNYKGQIHIDLASTRREVYNGCGLLPEVVELGVPLEEDIIRRDFTINALALSINQPGQVLDCTGGLDDIERRIIRPLKAESFFEDPSRIIRAFKFAARLNYQLGEDMLYLLERFLHHMPQVYRGGGDRIRAELQRFFILPESPEKIHWLDAFLSRGLHRLMDTQLPAQLDMPLSMSQISERIMVLQEHLAPYWREEVTWKIYIAFVLMGLPESQVGPAMNRIELTRPEIDVVEKSLKLLRENIVYPLTPYDNVTRLYDVFHSLPMGAACVGILLAPQYQQCLEAFVKYKAQLENVKLDVTGDDIIKLGVPQGEQVGRLLKTLLHAKLQGRVSHRVEELNWLKTAITETAAEETPS